MRSHEQLKLQLIEAALETEEEQVLRAALKVLQLGKAGRAESLEAAGQQSLPDFLEQGGFPVQGGGQELQGDIDEVFNP